MEKRYKTKDELKKLRFSLKQRFKLKNEVYRIHGSKCTLCGQEHINAFKNVGVSFINPHIANPFDLNNLHLKCKKCRSAHLKK